MYTIAVKHMAEAQPLIMAFLDNQMRCSRMNTVGNKVEFDSVDMSLADGMPLDNVPTDENLQLPDYTVRVKSMESRPNDPLDRTIKMIAAVTPKGSTDETDVTYTFDRRTTISAYQLQFKTYLETLLA